MKKTNTEELLQMLGTTGTMSVSSLVLRLTGSVEQLFDSLTQLQKDGLVEVLGNPDAVTNFVQEAKALEEEGLEPEPLREKVLKVLKSHPEGAESGVSLTKEGFIRTL